jgi:hypothetical protein
MTADATLQELATRIYESPLSAIRRRSDFPNLDSPLDIAVLLIDCDTEIAMNDILGFLENSTGEHLESTASALTLIGAPQAAARFTAVRDIMRRHGVTWQNLRDDFKTASEYQVTSFRELHGREEFIKEVCAAAGTSALFESSPSEDVYSKLCDYLDSRIGVLASEIEKAREPNQPPEPMSGLAPGHGSP